MAPGNVAVRRHAKPIIKTSPPHWIIRYTFYAFVLSLPFEEGYVAGGATLPKLFGIVLAVFALFQPRVCFKFPPKAFWCFAGYLAIFAICGSYLVLFPPNVPDFSSMFISSLLRLSQLLVLFWISCSLMQEGRVLNGTLWALAGATILLAIFQILGVTSDVSKAGRVAAFDTNPNGLATVLGLGLLALFGLAYGREKYDWRSRLSFWLGAGAIAVAMVQTGSRGAIVAFMGSVSVLLLKGKSVATKLKLGLIALAGIIFLFFASYQIDAVRIRWEKTFYEQSFAGREKIFPEVIRMIIERPLLGWGPVNHAWELGPRFGRNFRDEHNLYLSILAEVGIIGAIPFFAGLWLCWRTAWRGRHSASGILPFLMLLFVLLINLNATTVNRKYFWLVLSFAFVAGSYTTGPRIPVSARDMGPGARGRRGPNFVRFPPRVRSHGPRRFSARPFRR